jgi:HCOMODA/2-hydroxy-3-carboxy-muconic semialdehyde decarboxylase
LYKWGFLDASGHVSMRDPNNPNRYFLSRWIAANSVTPADIIEMDLDSVPVGSNRTDVYQERFIHGEMYRARPDVMAVVHSHTAELIVYGATAGEMPLRPVVNGGTFIGDGLPSLNVPGLIGSPELGRRLGQVSGTSGAVLLTGHGAVTVAPSLYALVARADAIVANARIQQQAIALGGNVTYLNPVPAPAPPAPGAPQPAARQDGGRGWQYWVRTVDIN